jgi:hypothetical protein
MSKEEAQGSSTVDMMPLQGGKMTLGLCPGAPPHVSPAATAEFNALTTAHRWGRTPL